MNRLPVIYGRNSTPASAGLRLFMWSLYSHVGIIDGDFVIEATAKHGVVRTPIAEFKARYTEWATGEYLIACSPAEAIQRARSQIGKPYDWLAIAGMFFRTGWDDTDSWVCSELLAWSGKSVNLERTGRYTVEDAYKHTAITQRGRFAYA